MQGEYIQLCKTLYTLLQDSTEEQTLLQAMGRVATVLLEAGERNAEMGVDGDAGTIREDAEVSVDSDVGTVEKQADSSRENAIQTCPRDGSEDDEVWEEGAGSRKEDLDDEQENRTMQLLSNDTSSLTANVQTSNGSIILGQQKDGSSSPLQTKDSECNNSSQRESELGTEVTDSVGENVSKEQVPKKVDECAEHSSSSMPTEDGTGEETTVTDTKKVHPVLKPLDLKQTVKNSSGLVKTLRASERSASDVSSEEPVNEKWFLTFEQFISAVQQEPELCQFFAEQSTIDLVGSSVNPVLNPYTRTVLAASPLS